MSNEPQIFNTRSRTGNVLMSSSAGTVAYLLSSVMGFVYRTVFVAILSASYLGINGLFSNILMLLSLSELGVGAAITYRFYKPIAENDVKKVGELMGFFKDVYRLVALAILVVGMSLFPFLNDLIKDPGNIPPDVNLRNVYVLFLLQSVISYVCVYRMSMWTADQKRYVCSILFAIVDASRFGIQMLVLWLTRDFTLTIVASIAVTLVSNISLSYWTTCRYRPVFQVCSRLSLSERKLILKDALALMCHRVGGVVVNGTDALVLARFVNLAATGLYSNYQLLFKTLSATFAQAFGGFAASFGNAYARLSPDEYFAVFRRMQFLSLGASGLAAACFYFLVDEFIVLWLGPDMLLPRMTAALMAVQFYLTSSQSNVTANLDATGLFVRDRLRSLVEAAINLGVSIPLAVCYGVPGVVAGTVIGILLTSFWRAPYILFSGAMHRRVWSYWAQFSSHAVFALLVTAGAKSCCPEFEASGAVGWLLWVVRACCFAAAYLVMFVLVFSRTSEFRYFVSRGKAFFLRKMKGV